MNFILFFPEIGFSVFVDLWGKLGKTFMRETKGNLKDFIIWWGKTL